MNFISHYRECVKAAYNFTLPTDLVALNAACISWLGTKLEPGPTLIAYESLTDATKADWDLTVTSLAEAFSDESAKETFLADQASFKRGDRSLVQYKNELMRLMRVYLPDLAAVPVEFNRQATTRFIEGLEDDELKRLLRRHCRRLKNTIDEAYTFTVDYESSELQTKIREGETTAAFGRMSIGASSAVKPKILQRTASSSQRSLPQPRMGAIEDPVYDELRTKSKIHEMRIQELIAKNAHTNDRIDILSKEVGFTSVHVAKLEKSMESRFDRIEQILHNNNDQRTQTNANQAQGSNFRQFGTGQRVQYQNGNRGFRGTHSVPSPPNAVGGIGRSSAQPGQSQSQLQSGNFQARSAAPYASNPPSARVGAVDAPEPVAAVVEDEDETEVKGPTGWWTPNCLTSEVAGYEEDGGNLSYGLESFRRQ